MLQHISIAVLISTASSILFAMESPQPAAFAWYLRPEAQHYLLQQHNSNNNIITIIFADDLDTNGQPRQSSCALDVLNNISSVLRNGLDDTNTVNSVISVQKISLQAFMLAAYCHYLKDVMKIDISKACLMEGLIREAT